MKIFLFYFRMLLLVLFFSFSIIVFPGSESVNNLEITPVYKSKGYYAGILDLRIDGGFYPLECFLDKIPYPIYRGTNPFIMTYKFLPDSFKQKNFNDKSSYYFVILKGELKDCPDGLCFANILIKEVVFAVKVSPAFVRCLCDKQITENELNYLRKHPFKIFSLCRKYDLKRKRPQSIKEISITPFSENASNNFIPYYFCGILNYEKLAFYPVEKLLTKNLSIKCLQKPCGKDTCKKTEIKLKKFQIIYEKARGKKNIYCDNEEEVNKFLGN